MMYVSNADGLSKTYHSLKKYSESLYPTMHGIPGYFSIGVPLAVSLLWYIDCWNVIVFMESSHIIAIAIILYLQHSKMISDDPWQCWTRIKTC